jgi:hypothetical protein
MRVLVVDIGGTNVKILATGQETPRKVPSDRKLTPKKMVADVKALAAEWKYDAVAIGYPGQVRDGRIISVCGVRDRPHDRGGAPGRRGPRGRQREETEDAARGLPGRRQRQCVHRRLPPVGERTGTTASRSGSATSSRVATVIGQPTRRIRECRECSAAAPRC